MALEDFLDGGTMALTILLVTFRSHFKLWEKYPVSSWTCAVGITLNSLYTQVVDPFTAPNTSPAGALASNLFQLLGTFTVVTTAYGLVLGFSTERFMNVVPVARNLSQRYPAVRKYGPRVACGLLLASLYPMIATMAVQSLMGGYTFFKHPLVYVWLMTRLPFEVITDGFMLWSDVTIMMIVLENVRRMEAIKDGQAKTMVLTNTPSATGSVVRTSSSGSATATAGGSLASGSTISPSSASAAGQSSALLTPNSPTPLLTTTPAAQPDPTNKLNTRRRFSVLGSPRTGKAKPRRRTSIVQASASVAFDKTKMVVLLFSMTCTILNVTLRVMWAFGLVTMRMATALSRMSLMVIFGNLLFVGVRRPHLVGPAGNPTDGMSATSSGSDPPTAASASTNVSVNVVGTVSMTKSMSVGSGGAATSRSVPLAQV
ncbi:hypothetical protein H9P43_005878 [Blastocladiella emersonii ATCC 22665]|nr:hypothetical protein H9P43_005878 [Blastocladiella emersonii ATCC 22665]